MISQTSKALGNGDVFLFSSLTSLPKSIGGRQVDLDLGVLFLHFNEN